MICGMSSIRKGTATTFYKRFGAEYARKFMGHALDSTTLEEYYDEGEEESDITAAITGESEEVIERRLPAYIRRQVLQGKPANRSETRSQLNGAKQPYRR